VIATDELVPLTGGEDDYDRLLERVGDARFVLLGEASHGSADFYRERARITRRLIEEKGFAAVAVEADWPDAYRVGCYARGRSDDATAAEALAGFTRFPTWMWRNTEVVELVEWPRSSGSDVGFYGLDLYSLFQSMRAVIAYLEEHDPEAAARAKQRYSCFDRAMQDPQQYGYGAAFGAGSSCERAVVEQLVELCRAGGTAEGDGSDDARFFAEQNAKLVIDAERYYRTLYEGRASSWNLRDTHMADTLDALADHLGASSKVVVWAHNSHLGDARATQMGRQGEINLGQLVRERHGFDQAVLVGFTTATGTVMAADDWDEPGVVKDVRPPLDGSVEQLMSSTGLDLLILADAPKSRQALSGRLLERAIGVIYRPQTERVSHYFDARVAEQFDVLIHVDRTEAVVPIDP
jgi:erythromycin esterase-like protein